MSVMIIHRTKTTKVRCHVLPLTFLILLTSLVAYAAAGDQRKRVPQHETYQRLAILPWHLSANAWKYTDVLNDAMQNAIEETKIFYQHYSYYLKDGKNKSYTHIINTNTKKIWKKKGFFSKIQPQTNVVSNIGKEIHTDAVLVYDVNIVEEALDVIIVYLFAIQTGKVYSVKGYTDYFIHEGFKKVYDITREVILQYKNDHAPDMLVVQRQRPTSEGKTKILAQPPQRAEEKRQRQQEAARLAAQKRLEEQRQREQAARLAALQRQQEEQRRHEEAEKQRLAAERRRQEEAAQLAAQKRLEEQRQREQAARVAALQRQQEEQRRRAEEKKQRLAAERRRQEEATRLAALQRQQEEQRRREEAEKQRLAAERRRQEEATRLAAQKRLEEQRQREQAARLAALQRQQEEQRRQQEETRRLAALQRQKARDTTPPTITLSSHNVTQPTKVATTTSRVWVSGTVQDVTGVAEVIINGSVAPLDHKGNFSKEVLLRVGENPVKVTALDIHANATDVRFVIEREAAVVVHNRRQTSQPPTPARDTTPPTIVLQSHDVSKPVKVPMTRSRFIIQGQVSDPNGVVEVTVNGVMAVLDQRGNFSQPVLLRIGKNPVTIKAMDVHANTVDMRFVIEREAGVIQSAALIRQKFNIGKYYAMVIGNNAYRHLPKLETAVNDAKQVGKVLRDQYGFETAVLLNATRGDILSTLSRFRRKMKPQDNFLIYYAGHGVFERVAQEAYWLPVDAQEDDFANWIISDSITSEIKRNPANHILIVADSCYSGTLTRAVDVKFVTKQNREYFLQKMLGKPSRTLMASGGNEPVADGGADGHSIFAYTFLRALKQMDQIAFTAEELFYRFVKQSVAGNAEQTPEYSTIRNSGHDGGDFVFVKK